MGLDPIQIGWILAFKIVNVVAVIPKIMLVFNMLFPAIPILFKLEKDKRIL